MGLVCKRRGWYTIELHYTWMENNCNQPQVVNKTWSNRKHTLHHVITNLVFVFLRCCKSLLHSHEIYISIKDRNWSIMSHRNEPMYWSDIARWREIFFSFSLSSRKQNFELRSESLVCQNVWKFRSTLLAKRRRSFIEIAIFLFTFCCFCVCLDDDGHDRGWIFYYSFGSKRNHL